MDYSEAMSYMFRDEDWIKKIIIGGLIGFISAYSGVLFFIAFLLVGYYVGILRNVSKKEETVLPEWNNWNQILVDGILGSMIILVNFIVIGGITAILIVLVATDAFSPGYQKGLLITLISVAALFTLSIISNLGLIQFSRTNNVGEAFNFKTMKDFLSGNFGNFIAITIFSTILNLVLFVVGLGIFSPFTNFWGVTVQGHLFGQCVMIKDGQDVPAESAGAKA